MADKNVNQYDEITSDILQMHLWRLKALKFYIPHNDAPGGLRLAP